MVSNLSLSFMLVALIIQFLSPIALTIYFYRKESISMKSLFVGVLSFTITQIIIRIPLLQVLQTTAWYQNLATTNLFLTSLILAFSAGLFEETGRFLGFKWPLKNQMEWKDGIAFGIGHGGMEALYIGLGSVNNIIISLAINSGTYDSLIAKQLPSETADFIKEQLISTPPTAFLAGGLERLFTIFVQIGLTMLVLYGVRNRKYVYFIYSILLHTLINLPLPFLLQYLGIWGTEAIIAVLAILSIILTFKARKYFRSDSV